MVLNIQKLNSVEGSQVGSITVNGNVRGVATIPGDGFAALVGYMANDGRWLWVRKDFRK